jgi:TRAP-type C4-dicarboxylate transport system permease small subunit
MIRIYNHIRGGLIRLLEWTLIAVVAVITLDVLWGVISRSLGNLVAHVNATGNYAWLRPIIPWLPEGQAMYSEELARMLLIWITMLGGALAFAKKAHLGVDFFVGKMRPDARKTLAILVQCITVAFAVVVMIIGGFAYAQSQWTQQLPTMPWLTKGVVYAVIPVAGFFILLFALEQLIAVIRTPAQTDETQIN